MSLANKVRWVFGTLLVLLLLLFIWSMVIASQINERTGMTFEDWAK